MNGDGSLSQKFARRAAKEVLCADYIRAGWNNHGLSISFDGKNVKGGVIPIENDP
jgi:hypothetical protein